MLKAQNDVDDAQAELSQALGYGEIKFFSLIEKIVVKPYVSELEPNLKHEMQQYAKVLLLWKRHTNI